MTTAKTQTADKADRELLVQALEATQEDVLNSFAELPGAYVPANAGYVFVPGTRKGKLLLCAHADTVNTRSPSSASPKVRWFGDICMRKDATLLRRWQDREGYDSSPGHALGGDDRAGCAALWRLKDSGHSLLVTTGEERGLIGAKQATKEIGDALKEHMFAIQVDRRGDRQAVFYDVSTPEFEKYILDLMTMHDTAGVVWERHIGSCSDISHICDELRMCGVNLSAGYLKEHTNDELLFLAAWQHTVHALEGVVKLNHARFQLPERPKARWLPATQMTKTTPSGVNTAISDRDDKGALRVTELADGRVSVYFVHPVGNALISKKRRKRLIQKVAKLCRKGKIATERALTLTDELLQYNDLVKKGTIRPYSTGAPSGSTNLPTIVRCTCTHCLKQPQTMRHVVNCACILCLNLPKRTTDGRVLCVHRCTTPGCKGTDGLGGWEHEKLQVGMRCEYNVNYMAACPSCVKQMTH